MKKTGSIPKKMHFFAILVPAMLNRLHHVIAIVIGSLAHCGDKILFLLLDCQLKSYDLSIVKYKIILRFILSIRFVESLRNRCIVRHQTFKLPMDCLFGPAFAVARSFFAACQWLDTLNLGVFFFRWRLSIAY
jgi:hypothetical protein